MKKLFSWLSGMQMALLLLTFTAQKASAQPGEEVSYQTFYDELSPYGQWVSDPRYGNVFVPGDVQEGFRPYYTDGRWAMTDYGNTWLSDEPWGWACYHYGRWTYDGYYGWVWIPGTEWAPAWVSWRYGGGTSGWAPLGPGAEVRSGFYDCPADWWVFVGTENMYAGNYYNYWRGPEYNERYMRDTRYYRNDYMDHHSNVWYNYGPRPAEIERYTHHPVEIYSISGGSRAGRAEINGHSISMYHPMISRGSIHSAAPVRIMQGQHPIGEAHSSYHNEPGFRSEMHGGGERMNNNHFEEHRGEEHGNNNRGGYQEHNNMEHHEMNNNHNNEPTHVGGQMNNGHQGQSGGFNNSNNNHTQQQHVGQIGGNQQHNGGNQSHSSGNKGGGNNKEHKK